MKQFTKEQKKRLALYYCSVKEAEDRFQANVDAIESAMISAFEKEIPNLEFLWEEQFIYGIGNPSAKEEHRVESIRCHELED